LKLTPLLASIRPKPVCGSARSGLKERPPTPRVVNPFRPLASKRLSGPPSPPTCWAMIWAGRYVVKRLPLGPHSRPASSPVTDPLKTATAGPVRLVIWLKPLRTTFSR
jgi:hypothetical protein